MYCTICHEWSSVDNFSMAVQNGRYGKLMNEPFCLRHSNAEQRCHIQRLEAKARPQLASDDSSEAEEETAGQRDVREERARRFQRRRRQGRYDGPRGVWNWAAGSYSDGDGDGEDSSEPDSGASAEQGREHHAGLNRSAGRVASVAEKYEAIARAAGGRRNPIVIDLAGGSDTASVSGWAVTDADEEDSASASREGSADSSSGGSEGHGPLNRRKRSRRAAAERRRSGRSSGRTRRPRKRLRRAAPTDSSSSEGPIDDGDWVGQRFHKDFPGHGSFAGRVVSRISRPGGKSYWHVQYEDGDAEDLTSRELRPLLSRTAGSVGAAS